MATLLALLHGTEVWRTFRARYGQKLWSASWGPASKTLAFGRKVYVPGDPKGEWSAVARIVGGQAIELGGTLTTRLNPLDEGPRTAGLDDETWKIETAKRRRALLGSLTEATLGRTLLPTEHGALDAATLERGVWVRHARPADGR
jgi:hypothetical protein